MGNAAAPAAARALCQQNAARTAPRHGLHEQGLVNGSQN